MPRKPVLKDLRVIKTNKSLYEALLRILCFRSFNGITVNELCVEALVSRAAFYAHFHDKYDLLNYVMWEIHKDIVKDVPTYVELETKANLFVNSNKKVITNVLKDANEETLMLIRSFITSIVDPLLKNEISAHHIILTNFFVGGLLNLLMWIVENNFPPEVTLINSYLFKMLDTIAIWDGEQCLNNLPLPY